MKTSGSRRKYVQNGSFADERHKKTRLGLDELPRLESVKGTRKFYNGKINYGLLVRFLRGKIGSDWDEVYSEIINRIPVALLDYKEMIFWFVADKVDLMDGNLWNKKTQKLIWTGEASLFRYCAEINRFPDFVEFYVDPATNKLMHIPKRPFREISIQQ